MILENYQCEEFEECHAGTLKNILKFYNYNEIDQGLEITESLLLGLSGGINTEYLTWKSEPINSLFLKFITNNSPNGNYFASVGKKLWTKCNVRQTVSEKKAISNIISALKKNKPVITYLRRHYFEFPNEWQPYGSWVVVFSLDEDEDTVCINDWSSVPIKINIEEFKRSHATYKGAKNATVTIEPPKKKIELRYVLLKSIKNCIEEIRPKSRSSDFLGIAAINKWAESVSDHKSTTSWLKLFPKNDLFDKLCYAYSRITGINTSGAAHRKSYAEFLKNVGTYMDISIILESAELFDKSGDKWIELGKIILNDDIPEFKQTRQAMSSWKETFLHEGLNNKKKLHGFVQMYNSAKKQVENNISTINEEIEETLSKMSRNLSEISEIEEKAVSNLETLYQN